MVPLDQLSTAELSVYAQPVPPLRMPPPDAAGLAVGQAEQVLTPSAELTPLAEQVDAQAETVPPPLLADRAAADFGRGEKQALAGN